MECRSNLQELPGRVKLLDVLCALTGFNDDRKPKFIIGALELAEILDQLQRRAFGSGDVVLDGTYFGAMSVIRARSREV